MKTKTVTNRTLLSYLLAYLAFEALLALFLGFIVPIEAVGYGYPFDFTEIPRTKCSSLSDSAVFPMLAYLLAIGPVVTGWYSYPTPSYLHPVPGPPHPYLTPSCP